MLGHRVEHRFQPNVDPSAQEDRPVSLPRSGTSITGACCLCTEVPPRQNKIVVRLRQLHRHQSPLLGAVLGVSADVLPSGFKYKKPGIATDNHDIAGGYTASNAPDLVRPPKLSGAGPGPG